MSYLNCSGETILVNLGYSQVGLFNRTPNFVSICPYCRQSFADESIKDVAEWMVANLKTDFCPTRNQDTPPKKIILDLENGVKVNYAKFGDLLVEFKSFMGGNTKE